MALVVLLHLRRVLQPLSLKRDRVGEVTVFLLFGPPVAVLYDFVPLRAI